MAGERSLVPHSLTYFQRVREREVGCVTCSKILRVMRVFVVLTAKQFTHFGWGRGRAGPKLTAPLTVSF